MKNKNTRRKSTLEIVKTIATVERERERERERGCLYRIVYLGVGIKFEIFSIICVWIQSYYACHLVKIAIHIIYNRDETTQFCIGTDLSLCVRIKKFLKRIINIKLIYNGTRDGP